MKYVLFGSISPISFRIFSSLLIFTIKQNLSLALNLFLFSFCSSFFNSTFLSANLNIGELFSL